MKSTRLSSLFFIFFLCIVFYAPLPAISGSLYESLCNEYSPNRNIKLCLILLKSNSKITSATNYHDLSKYILQMALDDAGAFETYLFEMKKRFPTDPALNSCINEFYETTNNSFINALNDLLNNNPQSAIYNAQAAGFGAVNCEKAFEKPEEKDVRAAIHLRNNEIFFLSAIGSLALTHLTY